MTTKEKSKTASLETVLKEIQEGNIAPVYLIFGDEEFLVTGASKKIVDALLDGQDLSLGKEQFDGKTAPAKEIVMSLRTLPFFGQRKVVVVKDWRLLVNPAVSETETVNDFFQAGSGGETILLLSIRRPRRRRIYSSFAAAGGGSWNITDLKKKTGKHFPLFTN